MRAARRPPGRRRRRCRSSLPDARSLFLGMHYSLATLPEQPMAPRRADPRVGYFDTVLQDFSDDLARTPRQRYVNRWRLEKKDPSGGAVGAGQADHLLARPHDPAEVPRRDDATASWSGTRPSSSIGFKNAIVVKEQPDDADFDTLDVGYASVRWMINAHADVRRHRPEPRRPAHRRDPRRRHRLRKPDRRAACARCARRCWRRRWRSTGRR